MGTDEWKCSMEQNEKTDALAPLILVGTDEWKCSMEQDEKTDALAPLVCVSFVYINHTILDIFSKAYKNFVFSTFLKSME